MENVLLHISVWEPLPEKPALHKKQLVGVSEEQKQVDSLTQDLLKANNWQGKYSFFVFQSHFTSVFHTRDGKIYIPTSLIRIAKTNEKLLHILAHEIAHWENGDIQDNQVKIPISHGQFEGSECRADKRALEILSKNPKVNIPQIRAWLNKLKDSHHRNQDCEL